MCLSKKPRGSLSPWLHTELLALGIPAVCLETRNVRAALSAQRNKTDANDALGIAHIMRTGWFQQAHIKSDNCYRIRLLLVRRRNLKRKFLDLENAIRHSLKVFGIRPGKVGRGGMEKAVREAASAMLTRFKGRDTIKTWGLKLAKTKCHAKTRVAVARKLAIVMHAMWRDGTFYVGDPDATEQETDSWNAAKVQRLSYANS